MRSLISIAVLLGAVTVIGQEVQAPAISAIYDGVSSKDIQRELDFLQVGLHPAFGPAHPGGGDADFCGAPPVGGFAGMDGNRAADQ